MGNVGVLWLFGVVRILLPSNCYVPMIAGTFLVFLAVSGSPGPLLAYILGVLQIPSLYVENLGEL